MIDAQAEFALGTALLVLDEEIPHPLELCQECLGYRATCVLCIIGGGIAKLSLGIGV